MTSIAERIRGALCPRHPAGEAGLSAGQTTNGFIPVESKHGKHLWAPQAVVPTESLNCQQLAAQDQQTGAQLGKKGSHQGTRSPHYPHGYYSDEAYCPPQPEDSQRYIPGR